MAEQDSNAVLALIHDALQRLGKARLAVDLAGDLLDSSARQLGAASAKIAAAALDLRTLAQTVRPISGR